MSWVMTALLVLLLAGALYTVITPTLLHAAIGLAGVSVVLALIIFELDSPLAAVFELSVCAGLITAVFVSAISLTRRFTPAEERRNAAGRIRRFIWLPVVIAIIGLYVYFSPTLKLPLAAAPESPAGVRETLWQLRRFDLLGQLLLILTGVFGVVVLFKGWDDKKRGK